MASQKGLVRAKWRNWGFPQVTLDDLTSLGDRAQSRTLARTVAGTDVGGQVVAGRRTQLSADEARRSREVGTAIEETRTATPKHRSYARLVPALARKLGAARFAVHRSSSRAVSKFRTT